MEKSVTETACYRSPDIFKKFSNVIAAESTRNGGVSKAPYNTLNLGGSTGDTPELVAENNRIFFTALGVQLESVAKSHQVHSSEILQVTAPGRYEGFDALITDKPGIQLAVTIADCTPILIYDPVKNAVAAIHAGWRGTVAQITSKTLQKMKAAYGSNPADCYAFIGTCIDECSFEVGEDVASHFDSIFKRWDPEKAKYFVDLKQANSKQLTDAGLLRENIEISPLSTIKDNDQYFSYRFENGITGRMLATIGTL